MVSCDALARFCADQRYAFDVHAWQARVHGELDAKAVAVAAKYLSLTSWYGHEEELTQIAEQHSRGASAGLQREAQAVGIDLARFSMAVRASIALHRRARADGMERTKPRAQELVD